MEIRLWTCLTSEFLEHVKIRYHYEAKDMQLLKSVAADMAGCMRWQEGTYLLFAHDLQCEKVGEKGKTDAGREERAHSATVVMTLGIGVDLLQERYQNTGRMIESYMVESIGGELLMQGYARIARWIKEQTGYHVTAYHFFGEDEKYPLWQMKEILADAGQTKVTCNEAFCLSPRKSVVFGLELSKDGDEACEEICTTCGRRAECSHRGGLAERSV